jgi:hypothetical protein
VSDEVGEAYLLFAEVILAAAVPNESIIVIPLAPPEVGKVLVFSYVAKSKVMFVQLHETPKRFMTYGHCLGYSTGTVDPPLAVEQVLKFPSMATYIVAKVRLVATIRAAVGPVVDLQLGAEVAKRQCVRPLGGVPVRHALLARTLTITPTFACFVLQTPMVRHEWMFALPVHPTCTLYSVMRSAVNATKAIN